MKRYLLFGLLALYLTGCGSPQSTLIGTWENVNVHSEDVVSFHPDGVISTAPISILRFTISGDDVNLNMLGEVYNQDSSPLLTGKLNGNTLILQSAQMQKSMSLTRISPTDPQNKLLGTWKGSEKSIDGKDVPFTFTFLSDGRIVSGKMKTYTIQNNNHVIMPDYEGTSEFVFKINSDLLTLHPIKEGEPDKYYIRIK